MPSSPSSMLSRMTTTIEIEHAVERGANVRPAGGDIGAGETVVEAGARLEARHLAALAAAGIPEVRVARRPRAAVVVTGSELRPPGEALAPGQIYEANGILLEAQLASAGAEVERAGSVADEEAAHREALERGLDADVLVTSGGVSVGPHDLVRAILAELGVEEVFWGVSVKPGKPISFGVAGRPARLRPAREPGLGARRLRALRPAGSAGSPGQRRSRPTVRARSPRLAADAEPRPRRARTRPGPATVRRPGRRTARGPRVAHDRAGSGRGRARPHSTWKRRPGRGRARRVSADLGRRRPAALARPGACGSSRRARPCASVASQARGAAVRPRSDTAHSAGR